MMMLLLGAHTRAGKIAFLLDTGINEPNNRKPQCNKIKKVTRDINYGISASLRFPFPSKSEQVTAQDS